MGRAVDIVTPRVLLDLYVALPNSQKLEFLTLLGSISSPRVPLHIISQLPKSQQFDLAGKMHGNVINLLMPFVIDRAWQIFKEHPEVAREEFRKDLDVEVKRWVEMMGKEIGELEREKYKQQRDRKSNPEIVRRNLEICNRRKGNGKLWTQGRLAKEYQLDKRTIREILTDEAKWRRLAATLPKEEGGGTSSPSTPGD